MSYAFKEGRMWDWAVGMAQHMSLLSKDPSTRVGAVIFDDKRRLVAGGYNGLPRGVVDSHERLNAERNALSFATTSVHGSTLFCTHPCCTQCAAQIIQMGVANVCWPTPDEGFAKRWEDDIALSMEMFTEAGVMVDVR